LLFPEAISLLQGGLAEGDEDAHEDHHEHRILRFLANATNATDDHFEEDHDEDHDEHFEFASKVVWVWGASSLGGFILSYLLDIFIYSLGFNKETDALGALDEIIVTGNPVDGAKQVVGNEGDVELANGAAHELTHGAQVAILEARSDLLEPRKSTRIRLIMGVLLGDFFHNLVDGFFIGSAFLYSNSLGFSIVAVTVAHEVSETRSQKIN